MNQTSFLIGNLQIFEPVTVITNVLLAGFCFYWSGIAKKSTPRYFAWFYFILGFSILLGAFAHGMYDTIDNPLQQYTRFFALMATSAGALACIHMLENQAMIRKLTILSILQFVLFGVFVIGYNKFIFVTIHSFLTLGIISGGIFISQGSRFGNNAVVWMMGGILVNASTAVIHGFKLGLQAHFNHNDISHLILIGGCFMMLRGVQFAHENMMSNGLIDSE